MTEVLVERPQWVLDAMRKANEAYELSLLRREMQLKNPQPQKKATFITKREKKRIKIQGVIEQRVAQGITSITIDNFFLASSGVFTEVKEIPEGFNVFFTSKSSTYFTNENKTILIRKSDHWGSRIRSCHWYLNGYKKGLSKKWKTYAGTKQKFGMIAFSDMKFEYQE